MANTATLCNLTVDEALAMAQEMAERADMADNETGAKLAAIGQIYVGIATVRQRETEHPTP